MPLSLRAAITIFSRRFHKDDTNNQSWTRRGQPEPQGDLTYLDHHDGGTGVQVVLDDLPWGVTLTERVLLGLDKVVAVEDDSRRPLTGLFDMIRAVLTATVGVLHGCLAVSSLLE